MRWAKLIIFTFCCYFSASVYANTDKESHKPKKDSEEIKKASTPQGVNLLRIFLFNSNSVQLKSDTVQTQLIPDVSGIEIPENKLWNRRKTY